ncbi:DUF1178 family protein [Shinella zoogloeoides]|uniref:DUF1178 family protein n=1 Tax=Shinella zoogloeoides TaxID=352475 RepID=UPI00273FFC04|nr:DUF1178 family protein [Shinella zoogloeoides]WLR92214.1 DUF1178 family protein [Shinella zoogloeoides]
MIRYELSCDNGHAFEGWFGSADDFDRQQKMTLVSCPSCGSTHVAKRLMAPSVSTARKKQQRQELAVQTGQKEMMAKIREIVSTIRANSEDVGERFPEEARKIHYGESEQRGLIGKATADEVRDLLDEGVEVAPLPTLPDDTN